MEFLLVIFEYYNIILKKRKIAPFLILILSIGIGLCVYFNTKQNIYSVKAEIFHSNILNVLGILLGFSISTLAILLSVENDKMKAAKKELLKDKNGNEIKLYKNKISLFESVSMELVHVIILQGLLLISNFVYPHFVDVVSNTGLLIYSINIFLMIYCMLLLINNILSLYFILTKKE